MLDQFAHAQMVACDHIDEPRVVGATIWLTGLSSSGKTTIAHAAAGALERAGSRVAILDGDDLRKTVCRDLGFSRADRAENVRRAGYIACRLAQCGVVALVPVIAPYAQDRDQARARHTEAGIPFIEVYVATPLAVCAQRDVKGLYARYHAGEFTNLTGVDDPYEPPTSPDLVLPGHGMLVADAADLVARLARSATGMTPNRSADAG